MRCGRSDRRRHARDQIQAEWRVHGRGLPGLQVREALDVVIEALPDLLNSRFHSDFSLAYSLRPFPRLIDDVSKKYYTSISTSSSLEFVGCDHPRAANRYFMLKESVTWILRLTLTASTIMGRLLPPPRRCG